MKKLRDRFRNLTKKQKMMFGSVVAVVLLSTFVLIFVVSGKGNSNKFVLVKDQGKISYKTSKDADYITQSSEELELKTGTFIKTDKDSFAFVFLPDNSMISLDPETEIQVVLEEKSVSIDQFVGNTWHRVKTVSNGGDYEVKTPNTIASVRGTIFSVGHFEDISSTFVFKSEVEVEGIGRIEADKYARIYEDEEENFEDEITDEMQDTSWYKRNRKIDEIYEGINSSKLEDFIKKFEEELENDSEYRKIPKRKVDRTMFEEKTESILLTVSEPTNGFETTEEEITVKGKTDKENTIKVNSFEVENDDGTFETKIILKVGENTIEIEVENKDGKTKTKKITVERKLEVEEETEPESEETEPEPQVEVPLQSSIDLASQVVSNEGIKVFWSTSNVNFSNGFKISVTSTGGFSDSVVVGQGSTYYLFDYIDGRVYSFKICNLLSDGSSCGTNSNTVSETAELEEEAVMEETVASITITPTGNGLVVFSVDGVSEGGFKVLWGTQSGVTYPPREGIDQAVYLDPTATMAELYAFSDERQYFVKVCEYLADEGTVGVCSAETSIIL